MDNILSSVFFLSGLITIGYSKLVIFLCYSIQVVDLVI